MTQPRLSPSAYTVAWISALPIESAAAAEMLDQEHNNPQGYDDNVNQYVFGQIGKHNIVMACLPSGRIGNNSSAAAVATLTTSFPSIRFALMVGIGGGVPSDSTDIRLGDVVIGHPHLKHSGVVQFDFGKTVSDGHMRTGSLDGPPKVLLNAIGRLRENYYRDQGNISKYLSVFDRLPRFSRSTSGPDVLFQPAYKHTGGETCKDCNQDMIVQRPERDNKEQVVIHYGTIASGNQVIKDGIARDRLSAEIGGVLCFEMEGAGLASTFPCIVIRGICDYADSHKNKTWQPRAAATAATVTKEILLLVPPGEGTRKMATGFVSESKQYRVPFGLKNVPVGRFADRPKDIKQLERVLMPPGEGNDHRQRILVLQGLGGIGKTQLAVEFARKHQAVFTSVFWIDGDTEDSLKQSIADGVARIPEGQITETSRKYGSDTTVKVNNVVHDFIQWLTATDNKHWLLVFDNVDRDYQRGADDVYAYDIRKYIPAVDHGSILITTRLSNLRQLGEGMHLGNVSMTQAQAIFGKWYDRDFDLNDSEELLELLDGLPLALAQAATYMSQTGADFETYTRLYKEQWKELMNDEDPAPLSAYRNRSINTTWVVSYNAIQKQNWCAANLLLLWAHMDNKTLPFWIFQAVSNELADELSAWLGEIIGNEVKFLKIMRLLQSYCLVDTKQASSSHSTHPVVHEWAYHVQDDYQRTSLSRLALLIIGMAVPYMSIDEFPQKHRELSPHAESWVKRREWTAIDLEEDEVMLDSLRRVGFQLVDQDSLVNAGIIYDHALRGCEKKLGPDHNWTLDIVYGMGVLSCKQMDFARAEALFQRALEGSKKAVYPNYAFILAISRGLGSVYSHRGRIKEAEMMYQQALEGSEKLFGPGDISTIRIITDIGLLKFNQGNLEEAEKMFKRALEDTEKAVGPDHASILHGVHNLGMVYAVQRRLEEAEVMYHRALRLKDETFGPDHVSTLLTVSNMGSIYLDQGEFEKAEEMYQRALKGRQKALGPDHPTSLYSLYNIARLYSAQDKLSEAKAIYQHAFKGFQKALGPQDVMTFLPAIETAIELGLLFEREKNLHEARAMYARAAREYEMVFGKENPKYREALRLLTNLEVSKNFYEPSPGESTSTGSVKHEEVSEEDSEWIDVANVAL